METQKKKGEHFVGLRTYDLPSSSPSRCSDVVDVRSCFNSQVRLRALCWSVPVASLQVASLGCMLNYCPRGGGPYAERCLETLMVRAVGHATFSVGLPLKQIPLNQYMVRTL